jgi:hypothetical protein
MRKWRTPGALATLEREDRALLELFGEIDGPHGRSVDDRRALEIVRHLAVREAALGEIAGSGGPGVAPDPPVVASGAAARRALAGGAPREEGDAPLVRCQEYDGPLSAVMALVRDQVTWERDVAIPVIEKAVREGRLHLFTDDLAGRSVAAPALAEGSRWFDRAPGVHRLRGWYTRRRPDGEAVGTTRAA